MALIDINLETMEFNKSNKVMNESEELNMFVKGDKVKLIKAVGYFNKIGEIGTVVGTEAGIVDVEFNDNERKAYIATNEADKYFEKYEEEAFTLDEEYIDDIIANSQVTSSKVFDKCLVVACKLPNGFVIVESSACVDPRNYNEQIAFDNCMKRIKDKVWELEAYNLQEDIYLNENYDYLYDDNDEEDSYDEAEFHEEEFECDGDCENCPHYYEDDED